MMKEKKNNSSFFYMLLKLIKHSCIYIELEHVQLLFDYTSGKLQLNKNKPLYIFVSHRHGDHYSPSIFSIDHPNITYILSDDIHVDKEVHWVSPNQSYLIDNLKIETLLSTDEGVAFIVSTENKHLFFAGDLHYWNWIGEDKKWLDDQYQLYMQEIKKIPYHLDLACLVIDKRLESTMFDGLRLFLDYVKVDTICPIHYFEDYSNSDLLKKESIPNVQILYPSHNEESFIF